MTKTTTLRRAACLVLAGTLPVVLGAQMPPLTRGDPTEVQSQARADAANQLKADRGRSGQVVILGTGTPNADPDRSGPAVAVVVGDTPYLVDCGPGVVRRAAAAERKGVSALRVDNLHHLFITHLHSDHTLGLPDLIFSPWVLGRDQPLQVFGPPGTRHMVDHLLAAYEQDIDLRLHGLEGANENGYQVEVHEIEVAAGNVETSKRQNVETKAGDEATERRSDEGKDQNRDRQGAAEKVEKSKSQKVETEAPPDERPDMTARSDAVTRPPPERVLVYSDANVKVFAFPVDHGSWEHAFGFRFETPNRVIVISGDTGPSKSLIENARGCDVLLHEVYSTAGFATRPPNWQRYHSSFHTSTAELAVIANEIKPGLLILYHQLFWGMTDDDLLAEIAALYPGKTVSARDLDVY
jgi:ribonuclease BN (tRNA processing enzyme)